MCYFRPVRFLLLALQLSSTQAIARAPANSDSAVRARVDSATRELLTQWRYAWQDSQHEQPLPTGEAVRDADLRTLALHCHWIATPLRIKRRVITGDTRSHATCPIWYPLDATFVADERRALDNALRPQERATIGILRVRLRGLLDSAAMQLPGDARISGQRVRFALDVGDLLGATKAAAACSTDVVQCGLLRGLIRYRAGDVRGADSLFSAAAARMTDDARCAWTDVRVLLDADARPEYSAMSCSARALFNARVWMLSDPLYVEPGNERRAEHVARQVTALLLSPLGFDGRQHWAAKFGGEAVAETLLRYGWPTQMYWGGAAADRGHDNWLLAQGADTAPPYVVREYSRDRLHTVPTTAALRAPFRATPADWRLNAPGNDDEWWPAEHFARDRTRLTSLPPGQSVMLRRATVTRFAWAGDLDATELARPAGTPVSPSLFVSRSLVDMTRASGAQGVIGQPARVETMLPGGDAFVGIEIPGDASFPAARTRFGIAVAAPLNALGSERALSDPLLFAPPADDLVTLDADLAVRRMLGSTTLSTSRKVGVYWEGYGFTATDVVELEVRMDREDRPGVWSRVGGIFGLGRDASGSLAIRWREERGSSRALQRVEGTVPLQMRSIILDLSRLASGTYRLQLSSTIAGAPPATSTRALVLR